MFAILAGIIAVTLVLGVPVAFGMGLAGAVWILFVEGIEPSIIARRIYFALDSFPLLAIPLFIMMGFLAERSGLLPEMVRWLQLLLGRVRGGMAYVNVSGSMLMAGVSGTAVSDIASLGRMEIQIMTRAGYPLAFSAALTAASSIVGPIIPPSVAMIIYALAVGNVSIGGLFMAGVVPGLLIGLGLAVISWRKSLQYDATISPDRPTFRKIAVQTLRVIPLVCLPVVIVGGITLGIFTVTESAAIGVVYTLLVGFAWTRELRLRDIYDAAVYSAVISSVVGMLMGAGAILSWILTLNRVTHALAELLISVSADPMVLLGLVAASLLVVGMFLDAVPIIVALAPLLAPIARRYGIDDLQFAMVFILSSMIGLVTPPVGIILFMTAGISGVSPERLSLALLPFVLWMVAVVALLAAVPGFSLWLPRALGF
jgi:TRAP-type transport system large permease protein